MPVCCMHSRIGVSCSGAGASVVVGAVGVAVDGAVVVSTVTVLVTVSSVGAAGDSVGASVGDGTVAVVVTGGAVVVVAAGRGAAGCSSLARVNSMAAKTSAAINSTVSTTGSTSERRDRVDLSACRTCVWSDVAGAKMVASAPAAPNPC